MQKKTVLFRILLMLELIKIKVIDIKRVRTDKKSVLFLVARN